MTGAASPPDVLLEWIDRYGSASLDASAPELVDAACEALESGITRPPRDRQGARALLVADALLTAAVGRLARDPDPGRALHAIVDRIAAVAEGEDV